LKTTKKSSWLPLAEERSYKKRYLVRQQQDREAEEEIEAYEPEQLEFPENDSPVGI